MILNAIWVRVEIQSCDLDLSTNLDLYSGQATDTFGEFPVRAHSMRCRVGGNSDGSVTYRETYMAKNIATGVKTYTAWTETGARHTCRVACAVSLFANDLRTVKSSAWDPRPLTPLATTYLGLEKNWKELDRHARSQRTDDIAHLGQPAVALEL